MEPVSFAVVGIGGYGSTHIDVINTLEAEGIARLEAGRSLWLAEGQDRSEG